MAQNQTTSRLMSAPPRATGAPREDPGGSIRAYRRMRTKSTTPSTT